MRKCLFLALALTLVLLGSAPKARAWGAAHVGYTHVGPGGAYHYGRTAAVRPYGGYGVGHVGAVGGVYGVGGAYGAYPAYGYPAPAYYPYAPVYSGGYAVGGYHYGGYAGGAVRAGGVRFRR